MNVDRLRTYGHLHVLIGVTRLLVQLLHPFIQAMLGISDLPKSFLELLDLLRTRVIEGLLLFPGGWSLSPDIVQIVLAVFCKLRVFELPTLPPSA